MYISERHNIKAIMIIDLAKRLNTKVYATPTKRRFITAQENKELDSLLSDDPLKAQIHLFPMGQIQEEVCYKIVLLG